MGSDWISIENLDRMRTNAIHREMGVRKIVVAGCELGRKGSRGAREG